MLDGARIVQRMKDVRAKRRVCIDDAGAGGVVSLVMTAEGAMSAGG
jgi:hypothetical protein